MPGAKKSATKAARKLATPKKERPKGAMVYHIAFFVRTRANGGWKTAEDFSGDTTFDQMFTQLVAQGKELCQKRGKEFSHVEPASLSLRKASDQKGGL